MNNGIDHEIGFYVPFQSIHHWTGASDPLNEVRVVGDDVGDDIPMARRGFGTRTIGPEFGEHASEIAPLNEVRFIGKAGDWIVGVAGAVVGPKGIVAKGAG